jgi:hypothetical protein
VWSLREAGMRQWERLFASFFSFGSKHFSEFLLSKTNHSQVKIWIMDLKHCNMDDPQNYDK